MHRVSRKHSPRPAWSLLLGVRGRAVRGLPGLAAVRMTLGRPYLCPRCTERYSEGRVVLLFILKLVNEMSQLLSMGDRQRSSSRGCVLWGKGLRHKSQSS